MVERMNRTIKEATVKRHHDDTHRQLETHLAESIAAYNYARRLKTLRGLTSYEVICKTWGDHPIASPSTRTTNHRDQAPKVGRLISRSADVDPYASATSHLR